MIKTDPSDVGVQPELKDEYDVIVIGAGPAGSTAASFVAEHGHRTLVLDRAPFPRFHVGESLIPETWWTLERLGVIDQLRTSAFPKKFSVQFVSDGVKESAPFYFDTHKPHESSQTWQVIRSEFDQMLLDNAVTRGATAHTASHVTDVVFEGDTARAVRVRPVGDRSAESREIACRVVIDATGQAALVANRLKLKQSDPELKMGTVWSYFKGAMRDEGRDEGATLIMQTPEKKSWFWYIPLPDDEVSVGCTAGMDYLFGRERRAAEQIFADELDRCPAMARRLESAVRSTDFFTTKDFSYRSRQGTGPGWVMVGDAFGFIDPVYSSGVFLALKSGELAADAVHTAFQSSDFSSNILGAWLPDYVAGLELFRKLVYAFYSPDFSFGDFLREHPEYKSNVVDMLIGDVFKPGVGDMFDVMGSVAPQTASAPQAS